MQCARVRVSRRSSCAQRPRRAQRGALQRHPARQRRAIRRKHVHVKRRSRRRSASFSRCSTRAWASTSTTASPIRPSPDNLEREDGRGCSSCAADGSRRALRSNHGQRRSDDAARAHDRPGRGARRVSRRHRMRAAAVWLGDEARPPDRASPRACRALGILGWTPPLDDVATSGRRVAERPVDHRRAIPGPRTAWLVARSLARAAARRSRATSRSCAPSSAQYLQSSLEVEHAANELAERYEEINLLYTISEILGRTVSLEEAAATILQRSRETVGARRALDPRARSRRRDTLQVVAALGGDVVSTIRPIALDDHVQRQRARLSHAASDASPRKATDALRGRERRTGAARCSRCRSCGRRRTAAAEPLGVVNLSDRRSGQPFSAGDQKLIAAIATQIGTAIQNTRLVRASLEPAAARCRRCSSRTICR